mmetsp:Transcript_32660/g.128310  ORF Transcript_32660/g.128310 Transcript_32660/m.128310 type:complete len:215 (-) Transcript_32660:351-995(-)
MLCRANFPTWGAVFSDVSPRTTMNFKKLHAGPSSPLKAGESDFSEGYVKNFFLRIYVSLVMVCGRGSELVLMSPLQLIKSATDWKNPSILQVLLCVPPGKRTSFFCSDALASKSSLIMFGGTNSSSSPDRKRRGSLRHPTRLSESHLFLESSRRGSSNGCTYFIMSISEVKVFSRISPRISLSNFSVKYKATAPPRDSPYTQMFFWSMSVLDLM